MAHVFDDRDFWCNPAIDKTHSGNLVDFLEERARTHKPMHGFLLSGCDLHDVDLVNRGCRNGYDMEGSEFYHADLRGAHMFAINLKGGSLMKADLRGANLHCADLRDVNLLGVRLENARLDHIKWGDQLIQEKLGRKAVKATQYEQARDYFEQAEEIYRSLRLEMERQGLLEQAGYFYYREMIMRRKQLPRKSLHRYVSKAVDMICGYGEKPLRVVGFSLSLISLCAFMYFGLGIMQGNERVGFSLDQDIFTNITEFLSCLYFSVVTFTTLGYGDLTPMGPVRPIAALEAFTGSFTLALFVVVFVKKMTR